MKIRTVAHRLGLPVRRTEQDARRLADQIDAVVQKDTGLPPDDARRDHVAGLIARDRSWHRPHR